jgi:hypothetical protein
MNTAAKLFIALCANPNNWTIADLQTVARHRGVRWRLASGSHCVFIRPDGKTLPVPAHRPIKPNYVRRFVKFIEDR